MVCQKDQFKCNNAHNDSIYAQFFKLDMKIKEKNKKNISCVQIYKSFYLFPRELVFHSFIVLLLAFVVQIIVSGKTVTEGL